MIVTIYVILLLLTGLMLILGIYSMCVWKKAHDLNPLHLKKEELEHKINTAYDTLANTQQHLDDMRSDIANAEELIARGKECEEYLAKNDAERKAREDMIEELDNEIKERNDNIHELKKVKDDLDEDIKNADIELQKKTVEKAGYDTQIETLKSSIEQLKKDKEDTVEAIEKLKADSEKSINALKEEESRLSVSNAEMQQKIEAQNDKLNNLKEEYDNRKDELEATLVDRKKEISEAIGAAEKDRDERLAELDESYKKRKEEYEGIIDKYRDEIEDLQKKKDELNAAIDKLTEELTTIKHEASATIDPEKVAEGIWKDLDRPVDTRVLKKRVEPKETEWLDEFNEKLKEFKISFDTRTINAFHTGLKSEEISPMVVLSGISGTGKSLLPQLYSEAIGMNFLQVAVQPRWDSPQDMMGFYNYMQYKFKATQLSRLLWQYDIYNNPEAAKAFREDENDELGRKLPMSIVLLDEMNLARVEYYFSDLLSKLEVRRNIGVNDFKRENAEIELESGALSDKKLGRNLFINNNTLFVGTMNEDETTQNLSDKVMDRSNVLRFGKPADLQSKPRIDDFNKYYSSRFNDGEYLSFDTWHHWSSGCNCGEKDIEWAKDIVTKLNYEFAKVGRPFAHRVWQSIEKYIKVYPVMYGSNSYRIALADQIEMKLMPKLSGLDVSAPSVKSVFSNIRVLLDKVGDAELSEAFDRASDSQSENIFFSWKGISR